MRHGQVLVKAFHWTGVCIYVCIAGLFLVPYTDTSTSICVLAQRVRYTDTYFPGETNQTWPDNTAKTEMQWR